MESYGLDLQEVRFSKISKRVRRFCQEEKGKRRAVNRATPEPRERKLHGRRKKRFSTQWFFCSNPCCDYTAYVANGKHGTQEVIRDLKCQACGKKFTARRDTILYRLRTHSALVEKIV